MPEVVPVADMSTETVANAFLHAWVSRFGVPRILISDRGGQSAVWSQLMKTLGIERKRTTSYHPESNGAIERFHRTLKNALRARCQDTPHWYSALPLVLLGIRSSISKSGFTPAQVLYGSNPGLPTQFFIPSKPKILEPNSDFLQNLNALVRDFPAPERRHPSAHYVPKSLATASHVWVLNRDPKGTLSSRYVGPYRVVERAHKIVTIEVDGKNQTISIDRVKPAFLQSDEKAVEIIPEIPMSEQADLYKLPESKAEQTDKAPAHPGPPHFDENSVIYAKFGGYPPWPAAVVNPRETPLKNHRQPKNSVAVRFFSTNRFAYVDQQECSNFEPKSTGHRGLAKAIRLAHGYIAGMAEIAVRETGNSKKHVHFAQNLQIRYIPPSQAPSSTTLSSPRRKQYVCRK